MRILRSFLYLLGLALAFAAGYKLNGTDQHKPLQVLYMEDAGLAIPVEQQVLALVLSDPCHDAQMAVLAEDYRRARILGANTKPRPKPEEVKTLPLTDYIQTFGQRQVMTAATHYVQAYNECLTRLLSKAPPADTAAPQAGSASQQKGTEP